MDVFTDITLKKILHLRDLVLIEMHCSKPNGRSNRRLTEANNLCDDLVALRCEDIRKEKTGIVSGETMGFVD